MWFSWEIYWLEMWISCFGLNFEWDLWILVLLIALLTNWRLSVFMRCWWAIRKVVFVHRQGACSDSNTIYFAIGKKMRIFSLEKKLEIKISPQRIVGIGIEVRCRSDEMLRLVRWCAGCPRSLLTPRWFIVALFTTHPAEMRFVVTQKGFVRFPFFEYLAQHQISQHIIQALYQDNFVENLHLLFRSQHSNILLSIPVQLPILHFNYHNFFFTFICFLVSYYSSTESSHVRMSKSSLSNAEVVG